MSRNSINRDVDLSNRESKRQLLTEIGAMAGLYEVSITPRRATRSNQQNRWYWGCIVKAFGEFLEAQGEHLTADEVHRICGAKFLRKSALNRDTGEIIGEYIRSTTTLDAAEFSDYCESVRMWLADMFGIIVPDPN